jgi:hypothetical protein
MAECDCGARWLQSFRHDPDCASKKKAIPQSDELIERVIAEAAESVFHETNATRGEARSIASAIVDATITALQPRKVEIRNTAIREAAAWVAENITNSGKLASVAMLDELGVTNKTAELLSALNRDQNGAKPETLHKLERDNDR